MTFEMTCSTVRAWRMGSAGGDLSVSAPQIHKGSSPNKRKLYLVSDAREQRAANFDLDDAGVTFLGTRPFSRARIPSLVCNAIQGADAVRWWSIEAT